MTYFGIKIGMTEISSLWARGYSLVLHVSRLYLEVALLVAATATNLPWLFIID